MDWKRCAAMGLLLLATGCGGEKGKKVSQGEYGQSWRLTVMEVDTPQPKGMRILASQGFQRIYLQASILTVCPTAASPLIRTTCAAATSLSVV
jgi:hypothetical protein